MFFWQITSGGTDVEHALGQSSRHIARYGAEGKGLSFKNSLLLPETVLRDGFLYRVTEVMGRNDAEVLRSARFSPSAERFPIWAPSGKGEKGQKPKMSPTYVADIVDTDAAEDGFRGFARESHEGLVLLAARECGYEVERKSDVPIYGSVKPADKKIFCGLDCKNVVFQVVKGIVFSVLANSKKTIAKAIEERAAVSAAAAFEVALFMGEVPPELPVAAKTILCRGKKELLVEAHDAWARSVADQLVRFAKERQVVPVFAKKRAAIRQLSQSEQAEWVQSHEAWKKGVREHFSRLMGKDMSRIV